MYTAFLMTSLGSLEKAPNSISVLYPAYIIPTGLEVSLFRSVPLLALILIHCASQFRPFGSSKYDKRDSHRPSRHPGRGSPARSPPPAAGGSSLHHAPRSPGRHRAVSRPSSPAGGGGGGASKAAAEDESQSSRRRRRRDPSPLGGDRPPPPPLPPDVQEQYNAQQEAPPLPDEDGPPYDIYAYATAGADASRLHPPPAQTMGEAEMEIDTEGPPPPPPPPLPLRPVQRVAPEVQAAMTQELLQRMGLLAAQFGVDLGAPFPDGSAAAATTEAGPRMFALADAMHRFVASEFDGGFDPDPEDVVPQLIDEMAAWGDAATGGGGGPELSPSDMPPDEFQVRDHDCSAW